MEKLNIFSFNEEVFVDCNEMPYDNLFSNLKKFTDVKELPHKYIINLNLELKNDDLLDILLKNKKLVDDLRNKKKNFNKQNW